MIPVSIDEIEARLDAGLARLGDDGTRWYLEKVSSVFALKTGALRADYQDKWRRDGYHEITFAIAADLEYAAPVDRMTGVNWSYPGTVDHFATVTGLDLQAAIGSMIRGAFQ